MFTGLITDVGKVEGIEESGNLRKYIISTNYDLQSFDIGASIACNGCCLTVVEKDEKGKNFSFELSPETIEKTSFSDLQLGDLINLERSLTLSAELGGHLVTGHVDFVSEVKSIKTEQSEYGENWVVEFVIPKEFAKFIAEKGSVCINGVSLTVNKAAVESFEVNIIPHTLKNTNLKNLQKSYKVNIEIDMIARYLNNIIEKRNID